MTHPAESLPAAARRAWPYFAPIWALSAAFPIAFTTLAVAQRHPIGFFWVAIAPAWFVAFFLPEIPLRRGQITRRQRATLGMAAPVLVFAAAVLVQSLLLWAVTR